MVYSICMCCFHTSITLFSCSVTVYFFQLKKQNVTQQNAVTIWEERAETTMPLGATVLLT